MDDPPADMDNPPIANYARVMVQLAQKGEGFPGQRIVVLPHDVVARALMQPLLSGLLPTDVGYFPRAAGHFRRRDRGVDQAIVIYCTRGCGWCEMAGRRHEVRSGDVLVVPPNVPHAYGAADRRPWTIFWFHAAGRHVPLFLEELGAGVDRPVFFLGDAPQPRALFEEVLETLEHGYTPRQLMYAAQTLGHLLGSLSWRRHQRWRSKPNATQRVGQTVQYMKQHLDQPLSVAALAALANLSPSHYSALFRLRTGYSPLDYFTRLRMHRACQLLDTTSQPVQAVATQVGYVDQLYFSRVFKALYGVSPSQHRRTRKG